MAARVIVFAKHAAPGRVKTRLVPPLTAELAADLHDAALADVLSLARAHAGDAPRLHLAGEARDLEAARERYEGIEVHPQVGVDLGQRLAAAFAGELAGGARRVIVVGSDHPTLPGERIASASRHLEASDVVFGPCEDGGYYLVGIRREAWPRAEAIFRDIPWSTSDALDVSVERALAAELSVSLLTEWYDVDRLEDLERLAEDAAADSHCGRLLAEWRALGALSPDAG